MIFISFCNSWPARQDVVGGREIFPYEFFHNLAELGCDVRIYFLNGKPEQTEGLRAKRLPQPRNRYLRKLVLGPLTFAIPMLIKIGARVKGESVVWYQAPPWPSHHRKHTIGRALFGLAPKLGVKTLGRIHDLPHEHWKYRVKNALESGVKDPVLEEQEGEQRENERVLFLQMSRMTGVIIVSEEVKNYLPDARGSDRNLMISNPGLNPTLLENLAAWDPPLNATPWRLGYLGSQGDTSLKLAIRAFAASRADVEKELLLAASEIHIQPLLDGEGEINVKYVSNVRYASFSDIANKIDIWVVPHSTIGGDTLPSIIQMTLQLKVPLYLGSGRPVVVTKTRALEVSDFAPYLFFTGHTPEAVAATIDGIIGDPQAARRKAEEGKKYVQTQKTWRVAAKEILNRLQSS